MFKKTFAAPLTLFTALFVAAGAHAECDPGERRVVMSIVTALEGHPKGETSMALARRVNEELDGILCMEVFGNSELHDDDTVFEAMLDGEVHLAAPSFPKFFNYTDRLQLFDLPFLFDGPLEAMAFFETDAARELREEMSSQGFVGLGFWTNGMRQISSVRPLKLPSDAAGLTFRIQPSRVVEEQFRLMGASTTRMAFSKVFGALESGEVQGQQNTWSNIYTKQFHTVQNGVTETNHSYNGYLAVTSTRFLNSLDPQTRETFLYLFELTTHEYNRFAFEINQVRRQDILDDGGEIRTLTADERQAWRDTFAPIYRSFEGEIGADLIAAAQAVNGGAEEETEQFVEIND